MHVLITGATGFVGTGVLAEALAAPAVTAVTVLTRRATGVEHPKLNEWIVADMGDLSSVADGMASIDACFWCLGTSSAGMDEATYTRITYDLTLHAAELLVAQNPNAWMCFLSGSGADGGAMWATVKKRTEDALSGLGLAGVTVFRPAYIRGRHGATLRGFGYRVAYAIFTVFSPIIRALGGGTSNAEIGQAMIVAVQERLSGAVLTSKDINAVAARLGSG